MRGFFTPSGHHRRADDFDQRIGARISHRRRRKNPESSTTETRYGHLNLSSHPSCIGLHQTRNIEDESNASITVIVGTGETRDQQQRASGLITTSPWPSNMIHGQSDPLIADMHHHHLTDALSSSPGGQPALQ